MGLPGDCRAMGICGATRDVIRTIVFSLDDKACLRTKFYDVTVGKRGTCTHFEELVLSLH